jgi:AbrB family looped-hinge helix DNA binding protein
MLQPRKSGFPTSGNEAMSTFVKLQRKGQVTIPTRLRAQLGLADGDLVEARAHRGRIVLTPKLIVDREYTPAQRRAIDARLAKAEADIEAGRVSKPFSNHSEFIAKVRASCPATELTPHPSGDGWRKRRRRTPSPQGRGLPPWGGPRS